MISELLYDNNIASLRYDKRGIGASDTSESGLTFDMYINDAVEWISYLKHDKRISSIIIIGHSEGSLIGIIAAEHADVQKFVSLCGAGEPIYLTIARQLKNTNFTMETLTRSTAIMDSLKEGYLVKLGQELNMLFRPSVQPYMISWFKYDPCKEISQLAIPVLIVEGTMICRLP